MAPDFQMTDLPLIALLIGAVLAGTHLLALLAPGPCMTQAALFPRSRAWGTLLLVVAVAWTAFLAATTDLGEFSPMRPMVLGGTLIAGVLLWKFVPDFLSSRSLGFLLLLAANPVLESTFLQHGALKIALVLLAYAWALAGLFLVGMPSLHRDLIGWACGKSIRWTLACWAGILYGLFLLVAGGLMILRS